MCGSACVWVCVGVRWSSQALWETALVTNIPECCKYNYLLIELMKPVM